MPTLEGLTPTILWTTMFGMLCVAAIFLICFEVYKAITYIQDRKRQHAKEVQQKLEAQKPDFAEKVSKKVITELGPRLEEIEQNLQRDKKRLETHEQLISSVTKGQDEIHDGLSAIAKFMLAISTYGNIGESEKLKEASMELQKYLTEKL